MHPCLLPFHPNMCCQRPDSAQLREVCSSRINVVQLSLLRQGCMLALLLGVGQAEQQALFSALYQIPKQCHDGWQMIWLYSHKLAGRAGSGLWLGP